MVEREERVSLVGHHFEEGVAHQSLVEGQAVEYTSERVALAIGSLDKGAKQRLLLVERKTLAGYVVGLVVDYSSVGGRAARHEREGIGEHIVVAPAPELLALHGT